MPQCLKAHQSLVSLVRRVCRTDKVGLGEYLFGRQCCECNEQKFLRGLVLVTTRTHGCGVDYRGAAVEAISPYHAESYSLLSRVVRTSFVICYCIRTLQGSVEYGRLMKDEPTYYFPKSY